MNLYIEIQNGQVKNHPAFEDNLVQAFGAIPEHWIPFERVQRPLLGAYEVMQSETPTYELIDGVYKDVWHKRDLTAEEKTAKQQAVITSFNAREQVENWSAWVFDEATCTMIPPIPRPEPDQKKLDANTMTVWCGTDHNWKDTPPRPEGQYKFNFFAWQWVEITP